VLLVFVIVGVAFLTLLEYKVLGYIHVCEGPNRVGFVGIFQAFRDAITLFTREQYFSLISNYSIYFFLLFWGFLLLFCFGCSFLIRMLSFLLSWVCFFACTRLSVYTVMVAGWSFNSGFSFWGGGGFHTLTQTYFICG
jgi:NADH:ubiquinone oxidoreductase subunit H